MATERGIGSVSAVSLLPLDAGAAAVSSHLVAGVSRRVRLPCRLLPEAELVGWSQLAGRDQLDADQLLVQLESARLEFVQPDHALVGITAKDIGSPLFTHFFGRARLGGGAALVSLARLAPPFYGLKADDGLMRERAELEVMHELGHLFGLEHCRDPECVMRFAGTVEAIDLRGGTYCPTCMSSVQNWNRC